MKVGLWIGVVGGAVGGVVGGANPWAGAAIGAALAAVGGLRQRSEDRPFQRIFAEGDWTPGPEGFELTIAASIHGKGERASAHVDLLNVDTGDYHEAGFDVVKRPIGDIILGASRRVAGRVTIQ